MTDSEPRAGIYATAACIGMGFPRKSMENVVDRFSGKITAVCCDAGSTDPGPQYLATGKPFFGRDVCARDLGLSLEAASRLEAPLLVGSCGFHGLDSGVDMFNELILNEAERLGLGDLRIVRIYSQIHDRSYLERCIDDGRTEPLFPARSTLTHELVNSAANVVGVLGVEPYLDALEGGADVILAGRSSDAALFAAPAIWQGIDEAVAWHAGKVLECGASCAVPQLPFDGVVALMDGQGFEVEPATDSAEVKCTPLSVAAHFMHETSNPTRLVEPSGVLDVEGAHYRQVAPRTVAAGGASFERMPYTIKLEGAELLGHRVVVNGTVRDPLLIPQLQGWLENDVRQQIEDRIESVYGSNGSVPQFNITFFVTSLPQPTPQGEMAIDVPGMVGVTVDVVAPDKLIAQEIAVTARQVIMHGGFPGRKNWLGGNLATPFPNLDGGEVARFSLCHRFSPNTPDEWIRIDLDEKAMSKSE